MLFSYDDQLCVVSENDMVDNALEIKRGMKTYTNAGFNGKTITHFKVVLDDWPREYCWSVTLFSHTLTSVIAYDSTLV